MSVVFQPRIALQAKQRKNSPLLLSRQLMGHQRQTQKERYPLKNLSAANPQISIPLIFYHHIQMQKQNASKKGTSSINERGKGVAAINVEMG